MTDLHRTALFNESQRHHVSAERPLPLYHQLYTFIKNFILDGTLHHAERLPSEIELAEIFNVSRITVKRAVNELAAEQLVERARGKGTHVIYKYTPKPVQAPLLGILFGNKSPYLTPPQRTYHQNADRGSCALHGKSRRIFGNPASHLMFALMAV